MTEKMLREWRALSRELVTMGAGDLAAMIEDARVRLAREASCAAAAIKARQTAQQGTPGYTAAARQWDDSQVQALMTQAAQALGKTKIEAPAANTPPGWCEQLKTAGK